MMGFYPGNSPNLSRRLFLRPHFGVQFSYFLSLMLLFLLFSTRAAALSEFYWEVPEVFSPQGGSFPVSAYNERISVIAWQEREGGGEGGATLRVSAAVKTAGEPWRIYSSIGGPYTYTSAEPAILSVAVDAQDRIFIAAAASTTQTEILVSSDAGLSFQSYQARSLSDNAVAPRIFTRSDGGYILFVTRGRDQSLSIHYSLSQDGLSWGEFRPFVTEPDLQLNFLPTHVSLDGAEYVVFQSYVGGADGIPSFQLFLKSSLDGGETWSPARRITSFRDPIANQTSSPDRFDNQRPHLSAQDNTLFLVWERRFSGGNPQVYGVSLRSDGSLLGFPGRINNGGGYCNNPLAFFYRGETTVVWFDNRMGADRIYLAQRDGLNWRNYQVSGSSGFAYFGRPIVSEDDLYIFYQVSQGAAERIYALNPDTTAPAPLLSARNFAPRSRNRGERAGISWNIPRDPSGISGFSYVWSQDEYALPPEGLLLDGGTSSLDLIAQDDGSWYFTLVAQDYAGNRSPPVQMEYIRDTAPPPAATMVIPPTDERGFLPENDFSLSWNPPPASDIAGYTWSLDFLGPPSLLGDLDEEAFTQRAAELFNDPPPPNPRIMGTGASLSYQNHDNGVWRFSVSAIDQVGNIGPQSSLIFRTNKYIPHTYITYADSAQDEQGILNIRIIGRGFLEGGAVNRIILDRDGNAPYDREYRFTGEQYSIPSDREITGLSVSDIEEGLYRIMLEHPQRGMYVTNPLVRVDEMGTVKFGDYSKTWEPSWRSRPERIFVADTPLLILLGVLLFCLAGCVVSLRGIGGVLADGKAIQVEAAALITGDIMPLEKKRRIAAVKRRGAGLRLKLASFTIALVMLVVMLISIPLYLNMTQTQRVTLLEGLWDRSSVLLEGLASSARAYLPASNVLELSYLPAQIATIPEARYVTITGYNPATYTIFDDLVWATNDPDILDKIDTEEYQAGVSRLKDALSPQLESLSQRLNEDARREVGDLNASIASLTQEALPLATRTDQASVNRRNDIQVSLRAFETRLTQILAQLGQTTYSEPAFSDAALDADGNREFIFYKPVLFRQGAEDVYFRGLIRLEVSVDSIFEAIATGQRELLKMISLIALIVLAIGTLGALGLSTVIIRPIQRLVSHVELIRDTDDISKLDGVDIVIKSKDELATLGATINDMTHGLVAAAQAAADLTIGKELQKKFIPLDTDREGNKLTTGSLDTKYAQFFGYYEGAKGVSGDYFDYLDLDGRYFALMKCDVAGKGIPAALIMIQVATMFLNHFKNWKPTAKGMHIEEVVYQINDFIEDMGFKGRFAAFTLALFDSQTGLIRFCNAGDNIVHWYDASEGRMKAQTLPETPATGVLPNFMVESKGGYSVQTMNIDHGDILFLYTDGIEEAKRKFRDASFKEIICAEGGAPNDTPHGNHSVGQGDEELGADRVEAIINGVMNRRTYSLRKYHNPEGDMELQFDFTGCEGTVEEAIMAMVSVEKIFRIYQQPGASGNSQTLVDKKIDQFLKTRFLQYRKYCSETKEISENDSYMYYTHVEEDPQYDDLTIIGIKRK